MTDFFSVSSKFKDVQKILGLLSEQQALITNNITNVDTPNYVRKNSNFDEVMGSIRSPIETDLAKKLGPSPMIEEGQGKVVLETELMNMQKNFIYYGMVTRRVGSIISTLKNIGQVGR